MFLALDEKKFLIIVTVQFQLKLFLLQVVLSQSWMTMSRLKKLEKVSGLTSYIVIYNNIVYSTVVVALLLVVLPAWSVSHVKYYIVCTYLLLKFPSNEQWLYYL